MAEKRIIELAEATEFSNDDYLVVDSAIDGTRKLKESLITNAVGAPLVASTAAGMTDTDRVYVYTGSEAGYTSGNWYYYNGSSWTSGGVYNSTAFNTDTTLSTPGAAADSKTVGDNITDVRSEISDISTDTRNLLRNLVVGSGIDGSGNIVSGEPALWYYSDYIPADKVVIKANGNITGYSVNFRVCEYDSSKAFLRRNISYANPTVYTPQNDCAYLRFSFYGTVSGSKSTILSFKLQAEYGETATEYVPSITAFDDTARRAISTLQKYQASCASDVFCNIDTVNGKVKFGTTCRFISNKGINELVAVPDNAEYSFTVGNGIKSFVHDENGLSIVTYPTNGQDVLFSFYGQIAEHPNMCTLTKPYSINGEIYNPYGGKHIVFSADRTTRLAISNADNFVIDGNGYAIDLGEHLTGTESGGYIVIPYSASADSNIYKVFISQSIDVYVDSSPLSVGYNTTLWAHYADETKDFKLLPVLTSADLANNDNSFYYDGTNIYINIEEDADEYVLADDVSGVGLSVSNSVGCISNLTVKYCRYSCVELSNSNCTFNNCSFKFSAIDSNFAEKNSSSSVLNNCESFKARFDGFGNRAGETAVSTMVLNNCHAHYCYDDGVSHHNGHFYINGGEYDHNNKGGISSPTYGSVGNISNAYMHDNKYGWYAMNQSTDKRSTTHMSGCLFKGNWCNIMARYYDLIMYGCTFADTPTNPNDVANATLTIY